MNISKIAGAAFAVTVLLPNAAQSATAQPLTYEPKGEVVTTCDISAEGHKSVTVKAVADNSQTTEPLTYETWVYATNSNPKRYGAKWVSVKIASSDVEARGSATVDAVKVTRKGAKILGIKGKLAKMYFKYFAVEERALDLQSVAVTADIKARTAFKGAVVCMVHLPDDDVDD